ncbi:MAG: SIMPL domain-containing protein, partial [Minisyncoccia bacterium]
MNDHLELFGNNVIRVAVVGVLCILALFLFAETVATISGVANPTTPPADTITVQGTGQASLAPDIAHITFTVQNSAATVAAAQSATTKQANDAIALVKQQGIADKDVTTLSYDITPQYSNVYPPCPAGGACPNYIINGGNQQITGYQVSETIQITVRNLDNVSPLLAVLGKQNVQNLSGPDFALSTPNAGQEAARAAAITDAKQQAQTLAQQLGV